MAYTPTVWETGDIITAEKLNKAEQGIVDADKIMIVTLTQNGIDNYTADKTFQEIYDFVQDGGVVLIKMNYYYMQVDSVESDLIGTLPRVNFYLIADGVYSLSSMSAICTDADAWSVRQVEAEFQAYDQHN